jgi:hypothetical protein
LVVWSGEDDSNAQPDGAAPARGLATIRKGLRLPGKPGGAEDLAGHGEGREPPAPAVRGQQRAA